MNRARRKAKEINLRVLNIKYGDISDIIYTSKYAAIYEFDKAGKVWHKLNISGPLFLCRLEKKKGTRLVVLNQYDNRDFDIENIKSNWIEFNEKQSMVFFKGSDGFVRAVWMSDKWALNKLVKLLRNPLKPIYNVYQK